MSFCNRLRETRKERGLRQSDIAAALSIKESTYCGYETGKRNPDIPKLKAISKILQVSVDYLIDSGFDEEKVEEKASVHDSNTTDIHLQRIVECYDGIDDTGKSILLGVAESLLESHSKHKSVSGTA